MSDYSTCHFCGTETDDSGYEFSGRRHWVEDCRPDLVEHERGPLCTWTDGCYWDHERNELSR